MSKKLQAVILGGILGLVVGFIGGGFLGLVVGGTFLGGLDLPNYPGLQGYELAAYVWIVIGVLVVTPWGAKLALRLSGRDRKA